MLFFQYSNKIALSSFSVRESFFFLAMLLEEGGNEVSLFNALELLRFFEKEGIKAWIVGGAVRDYLLGQSVSDVDLAVSGGEKEIQRVFPGAVIVGKAQKQTAVISFNREAFDVFPLRNKPVEEDLARRDFTVNAMALDSKGHIYDPFDGFSDLRKGILRFNGNPLHRLKDDPIRALRLCRFASTHGLRIDGDSSLAVENFASHITGVSQERIGHEVARAFDGDGFLFFRFVRSHGLMAVFFPFLEKLWGQRLEAGSIYEGDCLLHSFLSLQSAQEQRRDKSVQVAALFQHLNYDFVNELLLSWSWPSVSREEIVALIKNLPFFLEPLPLDRAIAVYDSLGEDIIRKLFDLSHAFLSSSGKPTDVWRENLLTYNRVVLRLKCIDFLPDGKELKRVLGIEEGPLVGLIKTGLRQAAAKGEIESREDVNKWLWENAPDKA